MIGRVAAAAALVVTVALPGRALADTTTAPAGSTPTTDLAMVSESAVVGDGGQFATVLHPTGPVPAGATVAVTVGAKVTTRSGFDAAVGGHAYGRTYTATAATSQLTLPDGDLGVSIPVNPTGPVTGPLAPLYVSQASVFPVSFGLTMRGAPLAPPLVGFLVYSQGRAAGVAPLDVALTVPIGTDVSAVTSVAQVASRKLPAPADVDALAGALSSHPGVPVTVAVSPDVVARLDRPSAAVLAAAAAAPSELLAEPYFPIDRAGLAAAGLAPLVATEDAEGLAELQATLHVAPAASTAVVTAPVSAAQFAALAAAGANRFVVGDGSLSPLPAADTRITFGHPAVLGGKGVPADPVVGADADLSQYLTGRGDAALDAVDCLAGLAVVQQELPGSQRGVVLAPAPGSEADPTVVAGLLAGMAANPFLTPVTVDGLFAGTVQAPPPVRTPVDVRPAAPVAGGPGLARAQAAVQGVSDVLAGDAGRRAVAPLHLALLAAASEADDLAARNALVADIERTAGADEAGIGLPPSASVTLTARRGTIPLTVLSDPRVTARVTLRVQSDKLTFLPFDTGAGACSVANGAESCPMVLGAETTTVRLPVEARTSGVFALTVTLTSPGGLPLASARDTVRSAAVSNVGLVLIALGVVGIGLWWVRDARRGRRARQLVEPRTGEVPVVGGEVAHASPSRLPADPMAWPDMPVEPARPWGSP